jgi:hypothetical protein
MSPATIWSRKIMLPAFKYLVALAIAGLVAGCGGGAEESPTLSPQRIKAAQAPMVSTSSVTPAAAAELLLTAAEAGYPAFFPGPQTTQFFGPFAFRYYPQTNMYLGVVIAADPQYTLNGIYVVGGGFGTLANPGYQGQVTSFVNVDIDVGGGTTTGHTLVVTIGVMGQTSTVTLQNVPAPTTQAAFCDGLAADTTFTQIAAGGGGTMTINSCSFDGTTGNIAATLTVSYGGFTQTVSYTVTYTYQ